MTEKSELWKLSGEFDAKVWSSKFNEVLVEKGIQPFDPDWLTTWFASAIMAGYDRKVQR